MMSAATTSSPVGATGRTQRTLTVVPNAVPTLHVHRVGTGEPLVLLHGLGESHIGWRPVIQALAAEYDVIAIDLPGFGRSPALAGNTQPNAANLAAAVENTLDELRIGGRKLQRGELVPPSPAHFLTEQRLRVAEQRAAIEVQGHRSFGIVVCGREHQPVNRHVGSKLLSYLPPQRGGVRLAGVDLSAGKLPQSFQMCSAKPPRDEDRVAGLDDCGDDGEDRLIHACRGGS